MIEINNLTNFAVDKPFFSGVAKKVLKGENKETENISIAFVDSQEIQKLNKKYRGKDKATDVLSFDYGEVVLCPEIIEQDAKKSGTDFKKAMANMLIHGILHVLGYDHEISQAKEGEMFARQAYYLENL